MHSKVTVTVALFGTVVCTASVLRTVGGIPEAPAMSLTICPTSSGSSDSSPDYDVFPLTKSETVVCDDFALNNRIRARNSIIGGSMRVPGGLPSMLHLRNSIRYRPHQVNGPIPDEDIFSLNGSERGIDVPTPLNPPPPSALRHTRSVSSAVTHRPPPYGNSPSRSGTPNTVKPPPPYPGRVGTPTTPTSFRPKETSTPTPKEANPKHDPSPAATPKRGTGHYENVDLPSAKPKPVIAKSATVPDGLKSATPKIRTSGWLEYGCI
uniref:Secreted protein n=1 Tax=Panagrellus redivivus TaxID=6233 RepID=A0A7E4VQM4_PANRE